MTIYVNNLLSFYGKIKENKIAKRGELNEEIHNTGSWNNILWNINLPNIHPKHHKRRTSKHKKCQHDTTRGGKLSK